MRPTIRPAERLEFSGFYYCFTHHGLTNEEETTQPCDMARHAEQEGECDYTPLWYERRP